MSQLGTILVYSDKSDLTRELLTAATEAARVNGKEVKVLSINNDEQAGELAASGAEVYNIIADGVHLSDVAAMAGIIKQAVEKLDADIIMLSSNRRGKELAGRLAQAVGAGCLTDVTGFELNSDKILCQRNSLGGAAIASQYINGKQVLAIRPKAFEPIEGQNGKVHELRVDVVPARVKPVQFNSRAGETPNIEEAAVLVAVGQGLHSREDLAAVEVLARKLGGEVACSKPVATDKKWLAEDRVIGLSGKKCQPDLAMLLGISGQVQFTVGIRDARVIVAVNTDENAAINYMADYILHMDLHDVIREMNETL